MPFSPVAPIHDAAVLAILQQAYDDACREIGIAPHPSDGSRDQETREALAAALMDLAATGLRDPHVLRERAVQEPMVSSASSWRGFGLGSLSISPSIIMRVEHFGLALRCRGCAPLALAMPPLGLNYP